MTKFEDFRPINSEEKFLSEEVDILKKNKSFFDSNQKYIEEMLSIINGESNISIRGLDWFVANNSKKNNTFYKININGKKEFFYVNNEYKNQLNGYSKNYFDPFCRKKKIIYSYTSPAGKNIVFVSSIGQLNFFQWALRNKVIKYVQLHIKEIEKDMKETAKQNKIMKLAALNDSNDNRDKTNDMVMSDEPDPIICSSDKINSLRISPPKKTSTSKSDSDHKNKRRQLSKSVYDYGIKKSNIPIKLDFD